MTRFVLVVLFLWASMCAQPVRFQAQQTGDDAARVARQALAQSAALRVADRRLQCERAFGHRVFCDCLSAALPSDTDFQQYIAAITSRTPLAGPTNLQSVRDRCVAAAFP